MKKIKKYLTKKEYIIFTLSLIIVILMSFSYAFYYNVEDTEENMATTECFKLIFEDESEINLDKAYPLTDQEGLSLKPYTFTIKNECNKAGSYEVNIETINTSNLSTNYIRYKLNNNSVDTLGQQLEKNEYINENINESRNIDVGVILPEEEKTYTLRLWLDNNTTIEQTSNKTYKGKVVVKTIENKEPYQTIALNTLGGDISGGELIKVKTRSIGDIPSPTLENHTFEGWYLDQNLTQKISNNSF